MVSVIRRDSGNTGDNVECLETELLTMWASPRLAGGCGEGAGGARRVRAARAPCARRARGAGRGSGRARRRAGISTAQESLGERRPERAVFDSELDLPAAALPGSPPPRETRVSGFCGRTLGKGLGEGLGEGLGRPPLPAAASHLPRGPESSGGGRWALLLPWLCLSRVTPWPSVARPRRGPRLQPQPLPSPRPVTC